MDFNEILIFAKVVQAGSFTGAARDLGMPKSTVSRKVSELEARLGARLLQRTTRKLSLTDVGHTYYQHAARVVAEAEEAELAVTRMQEVPRGLLRVTAPLNFGFLGPIVASFLARHAEVSVELVCVDRVVNLVEEGFDLGIRAGVLSDSTLIARHLATLRSFVVASPAFLRAHGAPESPADLEGIDAVVFGASPERDRWRLQRDKEEVVAQVATRLVVNDFDMLREAALAGLGVAMLPVRGCIGDLRAGTLERMLPDWCSRSVPVHAVYPSSRHLSPKVKAFLDHVRAALTPPPWERGPRP